MQRRPLARKTTDRGRGGHGGPADRAEQRVPAQRPPGLPANPRGSSVSKSRLAEWIVTIAGGKLPSPGERSSTQRQSWPGGVPTAAGTGTCSNRVLGLDRPAPLDQERDEAGQGGRVAGRIVARSRASSVAIDPSDRDLTQPENRIRDLPPASGDRASPRRRRDTLDRTRRESRTLLRAGSADSNLASASVRSRRGDVARPPARPG